MVAVAADAGWTGCDGGQDGSASPKTAHDPTCWQTDGHRAPERGLDLISGGRGMVMFPETHNRPADGSKVLIRLPVPFSVLSEFARPPIVVLLWQRSVDRATVPEASVDKDRHTGASERQIASPPRKPR